MVQLFRDNKYEEMVRRALEGDWWRLRNRLTCVLFGMPVDPDDPSNIDTFGKHYGNLGEPGLGKFKPLDSNGIEIEL